MTVPPLGRVGIWSLELRFGDPGETSEAAAELEELGFQGIWFPGGIGGDVIGDFSRLLNATQRATFATGIINVWKHEPQEIADWWHGLSDAHKARALLGIGISHGPLIGETWGKPLAVTRDWVEKLTALGVPADNQCLAALGPKMVALSGELTAGAHPYLVTPEHSAIAREILGPGKLVAPEQGVVLESDPQVARDLARGAVDHYRALPNYRTNWHRLGIDDADIEAMSDSFIDALFAWGGVEQIADRVKQHLDNGADHVCLQVVAPPGEGLANQRAAWRKIAEALL